MDSYECQWYGEECTKNIGNWVNNDSVLSWGANIVIASMAIALVWWLLWFLFSYLKRPFCATCEREGVRTRTTIKNDHGTSICHEHLIDERSDAAHRRTSTESIYTCPKHHEPMDKVVVQIDEDFIVIDRCPRGCQLNDDDEQSRLEEQARAEGYDDGYSDGRSSGQSQGIIIGAAIS